MYIALIIIGLAIAAFGAYQLVKLQKSSQQNDSLRADAPPASADDVAATSVTPDASLEDSATAKGDADGAEERLLEENMRMGKAFEEFVCARFPQKNYVLVERVNDYTGHDRFAERSLGPDMVFRKKATGEEFAVECKYRSHWTRNEEGKVEVKWASEQNIGNYKKFAADRRMPVVVVIGIGGSPDAPAEVYAAPLEDLRKYTTVRMHILRNFQLPNSSGNYSFTNKTIVCP